MAEKKFVEEITPMEEDFAQWYTDIVKKAEMIEYTSVKGCLVIRPYAYAVWENIQRILDTKFKDDSPKNTVERIKGILQTYGIETVENWGESGVPSCYSLRLSVTGTAFGVNGKGITEELAKDEKVLSPGLKHKHYAPKAEVTIINGEFEKYRQLVEKENATALCFDEYADKINANTVCYGSEKDSATQAVKLFHALRQLDEIGAGKVYAMMPSTEGVGLAVYNRLLRAAGFRVVNL